MSAPDYSQLAMRESRYTIYVWNGEFWSWVTDSPDEHVLVGKMGALRAKDGRDYVLVETRTTRTWEA
jgi:hypothetical protein